MDAVIFDMDGVLIDGEPLHFAAMRQVLSEEGVTLSVEAYQAYLGTTLAHTWSDLRERYALAHDYDHYASRYGALVTEQYRNEAEALPGARELLDRLREAGMRCALASSSNRSWVETALEALHMREYFGVIVAGDEVENGKPDPEIYRAAAEKLAVEPSACLVIEDAPAGIEAGRRAGMQVVAVRTEMTAGLSLDGATYIIETLEAFDMAWLQGPSDGS